MRTRLLVGVCVLAGFLAFIPSGQVQAEQTIKIGINAELTGEIPKEGGGARR